MQFHFVALAVTFTGALLCANPFVADTQSLLNHPEKREKVMSETPETRAADARVKALGGSAKQTQQIYELSAEIFGSLARDAKGDPDEMEKVLEKGALDPESFANKLTPDLRKKLHDIAKDLEKSQPIP